MASATLTETRASPPWMRKPAPLSLIPRGIQQSPAQSNSSSSNSTSTGESHSCPSCRLHLERKTVADLEAQKKIAELELEVSRLSGKATEYVDRIADYEDEITKLHRKQKATEAAHLAATSAATAGTLSPAAEASSPPPTAAAAAPAPASTGYGKFTYFLSRKSPTSPPAAPASPTKGPSTEDLQKALDEEKERRQQAETQVSKISDELDELSAALFQQANEMVASEREARIKLERRVAELEQRDREKMSRLQNIERAVDRINRVRGLLAPTLTKEKDLEKEREKEKEIEREKEREKEREREREREREKERAKDKDIGIGARWKAGLNSGKSMGVTMNTGIGRDRFGDRLGSDYRFGKVK